jgi:hypothetical protein
MIFAEGEVGPSNSKSDDNALALAIARAWKWQEELESGQYASLEELAHSKGVDRSYAGRLLKLTSLAPEIVEALLAGQERKGLSLRQLRCVGFRWRGSSSASFGHKKTPTGEVGAWVIGTRFACHQFCLAQNYLRFTVYSRGSITTGRDRHPD